MGTIESSNVASTAFVDFLIDTSSNNDGARGASSYFKKLDNSELELMFQEMRLSNCNGLTDIFIANFQCWSAAIVVTLSLRRSEIVTNHFLHFYCSHDEQLRRN